MNKKAWIILLIVLAAIGVFMAQMPSKEPEPTKEETPSVEVPAKQEKAYVSYFKKQLPLKKFRTLFLW